MAIGQRESRWLKENSGYIVKLPDDVFSELLSRLSDLMAVGSRSRADEYVSSLARDRSIDERVVRAGIAWITLSANAALAEPLDEVREDFLKFFDAGSGFELYKHRLERVIDSVSKDSESINLTIQRKVSARGLLPYYDDINATVELRAVYSEEPAALGSSRGESLKIVDMEPIASIRIALDSGFPGEVIFQASREEITQMVVSLNDLIVRMDEVTKFCKKG